MDIVWKILAVIALVILEFIKVVAIMSIVDDIRKFREERKKEKEFRDRVANGDYPYLAFEPVTEHYGWTYESVSGKFAYIIWYHENGKRVHSTLICFKEKRTTVENFCRGAEKMLRYPEKEAPNDLS